MNEGKQNVYIYADKSSYEYLTKIKQDYKKKKYSGDALADDIVALLKANEKQLRINKGV